MISSLLIQALIVIISPTLTDAANFHPHYYERLGVLSYLDGIAVVPEDYTLHTLDLTFPTPQLWASMSTKDTCGSTTSTSKWFEDLISEHSDFTEKLNQFYNSESQMYKDNICSMLPTYCVNSSTGDDSSFFMEPAHTGTRRKRFLPFIAAALGLTSLGMSTYNLISASSVKQAVEEIQRNQNKLASKVNELIKNQEVINNKLENTLIKIAAVEKSLIAEIDNIRCAVADKATILSVGIMLSMQNARQERILHAIFRGDLTEEILSPDELLKLFSNNVQLKETVYKTEVVLAYKLIRVIPVLFHPERNALSCLLIIPVVKPRDISPLLRTINVGFVVNSSAVKIDIPELSYLVNNDGGSVKSIPLDSTLCSYIKDIWLCHDTTPVTDKASGCLDAILSSKRNIEGYCNLHVRQLVPMKQYRVTLVGILMIGYRTYHSYNRIKDRLILGQEVTINPKNWTMLPYSDFDTINLEGNLINSPTHSPALVKRVENFLDVTPLRSLPGGNLSSEWKTLNEIQEEMEAGKKKRAEPLVLSNEFFHSHGHIFLWMLFGIVTLFLSGMIWYCMKQRRNKTDYRKPAPTPTKGNLDSMIVKYQPSAPSESGGKLLIQKFEPRSV